MNFVLSFGTFDYFHPGHAAYLRQAATLGDYLVVVVARDSNVIKIKNKQARQEEKIRRAGVASFLKQEKIKGRAVLGLKGDRLAILKKFPFTVIALGYDQPVDEKVLRQKLSTLGLKVKIKRLAAYHPEKYKSSYCLKD
jgi:FAD synthetase